MGVLIKFPCLKQNSLASTQKEPSEQISVQDPSANCFSDKRQEQAFANLLKEWPCYSLLSQDLDLEKILELYYDDELTVQQDYALEYLFHMHDPKSSFDIANALYSWGEDDRNFFILSLNLHAEIIDQIKKQEY